MTYWDRYIGNTMPYLVTKQKPKKPLDITNALVRKRFPLNNLYYRELKETDAQYKRALNNYNLCLTKIDIYGRKQLTSLLKWLWTIEHINNSLQIYSMLSISNKYIPHNPFGLSLGYKGKEISENSFQNQLNTVKDKIKYLVEGNDL
jgi:hypothetical protein